MPKLKTSEKRLLGGFIALIFLFANYLLYQKIVEYQARLEREAGQLETRILQLEHLLPEKAKWEDRKRWVTSTLPLYQSIDQRDTYLITLIRNMASDSGVTISDGPNPLQAKPEEFVYYEETLVNVKVQGEIEPIVKFLYSLQAPKDYRAIVSLKMNPAKRESSEILCEVTLAQWWSLESEQIALQRQQELQGTGGAPGRTPPGPGAGTVPGDGVGAGTETETDTGTADGAGAEPAEGADAGPAEGGDNL